MATVSKYELAEKETELAQKQVELAQAQLKLAQANETIERISISNIQNSYRITRLLMKLHQVELWLEKRTTLDEANGVKDEATTLSNKDLASALVGWNDVSEFDDFWLKPQ